MKSFVMLVMICSLTLTLACSSSDPVAPVNQRTNPVRVDVRACLPYV
jgi:hypothetical protein